MADPKKEGGYTFEGICMSCKKNKILQDFAGLKLCHECEEIFFEPLIKLQEQQEHGKDIMRDERMKKDED